MPATRTRGMQIVHSDGTDGREPGWWIVNPPAGVEEMGPFATRAEAQEARRRLIAVLANCDKRGFITCGR